MSLIMLSIVLVCIFLSAFFSGTEMGLLSLNHIRLHHEVETGNRKSLIIYNLVKNPALIIACILIGNSFVNVAASVLTASMYEDHELLAGMVLAIVVLIFGETIPKAIFRKERNKLIIFLAPSLQLIFRIFSPFLKSITYFTGFLAEANGKEKNYLTKEKIKFLLNKGEQGGIVGENEGEIFDKIFELSEVKVGEVMTPRANMICLDSSANIKRIIEIYKKYKYSRIPVYENSIDSIIGIIYIKDILNFWENEKDDFRAIEFIRLPFFVPESKRIGDLIREFKEKMIHVAIVVDEYGGTSGIITLEDLLEEVFGEIQDEYDYEEMSIRKIDKGIYVIEGDTEIERLKEELKINFPEGDFETISGYILEILKHIPTSNEVIKCKDMIITIINANEQSINKVKLEIINRET
ncbi:MAG: hemolysin family protein [bacterium]|nr:hemolysin family protein [bacterium]